MHPVMDPSQEDQHTTQHSSEPDNKTNPTPEIETTQKNDEILARYEEMFRARYTSDDPAYMPYINKEMDPPPIVTDYFVRRQRSNWNDNAQGQRNPDRGYKRRSDDREWQGNNQSKRPFPDGQYQHQRRGWGHQDQRGQYDNQRWDSHPRQDWNQWNRQGQGSQPPRGQQDRRHDDRHDDRHRGGQSSSHQGSREPEWT